MPEENTNPPQATGPAVTPTSPPISTAVATGTRIMGTYEIEKLISKGGMGEVYRGRNIHTGDPVAIKIVLPHLAQEEMIVQLFQKEAKVLGRLGHDAIVRYHVFTNDPAIGRPSLIMEFVEGTSMNDRMKMGPMSAAEVRQLLRRLASGLDRAHNVGVIHRDLSPDNVILEHGVVAEAKIIDFGIAKSSMKGDATLLQGQFAGKFSFVAPEQLGAYGGTVDARTDVYSLALMMVAACQGKILNMGKSIVEAVRARASVPDLSGIYPELRPLLEHMLEPDPAHRPASMAEVIRLLDNPGDIPAQHEPEPYDPDRTVIVPSAARSGPGSAPGRAQGGGSQPGGNGVTGRGSLPAGTAPAGSGRDALLVGIPGAGSSATAAPVPSKSRGGLLAVAAVALLGIGGGGAYFGGLFDPAPAPTPPETPETPETPGTPEAPSGTPPETPETPDSGTTDPGGQQTASNDPPPDAETPDTDQPGTDQPDADTPEAPDTPETPPEAEDPAAAQIAFVRDYVVPPCTFLGVSSPPGAALSLEGFGTSVDPFSRFLADFSAKQGVEPDVAVRIVNQPQCPVVDYMNELSGTPGIPVRLALDMTTDVVRSGETVSGRIEGLAGRSVAMFLVNGPGQSTNLRPFLSTAADGTVTFSFAPSLKAGSEPTPQLLFVLVTDQPVEKFDAVPNGVTARTLVPFFKSELSKVRQEPTVAIRYFRLENR
jgi:serine/threonine-protein kinase